jgi:hypothetical protein
VLRGQGQEATCAIDAIKASLQGTDAFTYTNYSIGWASKELPEGVYELNANWENTRVQLRNGFWIAA